MNDTLDFEKVFQCPICQNHPSLIFQCSDCEEIRCSSHHCTGSEESGYARWAADGTLCRHCHTGYYQRVGFHSAELHTFIKKYREKTERPLCDFFINAA